jgi:hypothetical protein
MSVVWEDPPTMGNTAERFGRQPSPLRKEADELLETLRSNQGAWARLWDMPDKDEARKRSNYIGTKGYSFRVRETPHGWSIYGRWNGDPAPDPQPGVTDPGPGAESAPETRDATFPV